MKIIEGWEDNHINRYAIVSYSKEDRRAYKTKKYEAMYMSDLELYSFGGSVGYMVADFDTIRGSPRILTQGHILTGNKSRYLVGNGCSLDHIGVFVSLIENEKSMN